jgi:hypothetical protein
MSANKIKPHSPKQNIEWIPMEHLIIAPLFWWPKCVLNYCKGAFTFANFARDFALG